MFFGFLQEVGRRESGAWGQAPLVHFSGSCLGGCQRLLHSSADDHHSCLGGSLWTTPFLKWIRTPWGPPEYRSCPCPLFPVCRKKAVFTLLDLPWVPKGRFKQLLIGGRREWRNKGRAVKKQEYPRSRVLILPQGRDTTVGVVQLLSCVQLFATLWTVACQAPLSSTIARSLLHQAVSSWAWI